MFKKKVVPVMLSLGLIVNSLNPFTKAINSEDLTISMTPNPDIDIALTIGNTSVDVNNFERDIINELRRKGIDTSNVNISAVETTEISTNDANASEIFNNWDNYPNNVGRWELTTVGGEQVVRSTVNTQWTGFWEEADARNAIFEFNTGVTTRSDDDWIGFTFRMNKYEPGHPENPYNGNVDAYDMYFFALDGGGVHDSGLYKLTKAPFGNNRVGSHNMWTGGWTRNWNTRTVYFTQSGTSTPLQVDSVPGRAFPSTAKGTMIPLQRTNTHKLNWNPYFSWRNVRIQTVGNNIKVWVNNRLEIDYTDNDNPFMSGGYGPFAASQAFGTFKDIEISTETSKRFYDVIREPDWRDESLRFIVNVDDNEIDDFNNPEELGEILGRLNNEEMHYIGAGTNANRNQALEFISNNNGNGTFVDNRNYNNFISETAEYISNLVASMNIEGQYVLVGEDIDINVNPSHLLTNTANAEYPNGRWRIEHDYEYFDNNRGQASWTEQWQEDLVMSFDRPGRYEIFFEDINPNPRYIYAHRRPLAMFNLSLSNGNITYQDNSYDPDRESNANRGIAQREWRYLDINTNTWHSGRPTTYNANSNMMIQLRVLDEQGAWSRPFTRYVTGNSNSSIRPIADFSLSGRYITRFDSLTATNNSYSPSGRAINSTRWRIYRGSSLVYENSNFNPNISNFTEGDYTVQLEVRDSNGVWSEPFRRNLTLVRDTNPPEIIVSRNHVTWQKEDIEVDIRYYDDGGSGFNSHRYYISTSSTPPANNSGLWSNWINNDEHTFNITSNGERYIHIQARDNEGNVLNRTLGAYQIDRTSPNASISINGGDTFSPTREVELTINASDFHSGIKRITVSEGSKTRDIPLSSVSNGSVSIPWTFEEGMFGDIVLTVEDNAGNKTIISDSIIIDELTLEDFVIKDVINPTRFHEDNPFIPKANEDIESVPLLSGANIDLGIVIREAIDTSIVRDNVSYEIAIEKPNGTKEVITGIIMGGNNGEYFEIITLPENLPYGTEVKASITVDRDLLVEPYSTQTKHFPENPNDKILIGEVEKNIKEVIRFREIN